MAVQTFTDIAFSSFYFVFIFGPTHETSKLVAVKVLFSVSPSTYSVIYSEKICPLFGQILMFEVFQGLFLAFLLQRKDVLGTRLKSYMLNPFRASNFAKEILKITVRNTIQFCNVRIRRIRACVQYSKKQQKSLINGRNSEVFLPLILLNLVYLECYTSPSSMWF